MPLALSRRKRYRLKLQQAKEESGFPRVRFGFRGKLTFESDDLLPCVCGSHPVIEKDIRAADAGQQAWLIRCPSCDRRVARSGPFPLVRVLWNQGCYTRASDMVARTLREINDDGAISLCGAVLREVYNMEKKTPPVGHA